MWGTWRIVSISWLLFWSLAIGWNLVTQKKYRFKIIVQYILLQKHVVHRLTYSQYENPNIIMWGKRNEAEQ